MQAIPRLGHGLRHKGLLRWILTMSLWLGVLSRRAKRFENEIEFARYVVADAAEGSAAHENCRTKGMDNLHEERVRCRIFQ